MALLRLRSARRRARRNAIRLQAPGYNSEALVFPESATGEAWGPDRFSRTFTRRVRKLGVHVTFHGLRHSFATIALRAKVPMKHVSDLLGHTSVALTSDLYAHMLDDSRREAVDRVGERLATARATLG